MFHRRVRGRVPSVGSPLQFLALVGFALAVFATAAASMWLTRFNGQGAAVWLANGIAAAVLLRTPQSRWPLLLAVAMAANLAAHMVTGNSALHSVVLTLLTTGELLLVVIPMRHMFGAELRFTDIRPLGAFLIIGGVIAPLASGAGAALFFAADDGAAFGPALSQWFMPHALGLLTVTPLLMALPRRFSFAAVAPRILIESALIIGLIGAIAAVIYLTQAPLKSAIILLLVIAAFRLPTLAAAAAVMVVAGEAVLFASLGLNPIADGQFDPQTRLLLLQAFIAVAVLVTMPVSAVIGERDRALAIAHHARDEATLAAAAKSNFLATMSHEIRTPMTGVLGMIELLQSEPDEEERERYFVTLKRSAILLMTVLDDILDFSKIESGNLQLERKAFSFEELAQATLDLFGTAASQKGLLISMQCECPSGAIVSGDPTRVQQVMSNLINNAIKFTERGRITILVRAGSVDGDRQSWRVEVSDTGIGIFPKHLEQLFEPFVQAEESIPRRFGGTGLGLAISRWLVEAMGGTMGVESQPGAGSTFWFEIPLPASTAPDWRAPPSSLQKASRSLRILIVEDNPVNQMLNEAFVRTLGHRAMVAENGQLAVEIAERETFDCILMDMHMPEMDGMAATRAIRASDGPCKAIPIIALTADASPDRRRFYDNVGLTDFLTKPIDRLALAARLSAIAGPAEATEDLLDLEASDVPLIDTTNINQLCAAIGSTNFDGLLDLLEVELAERPATIRVAVVARDTARARREARRLKGAATSIGAMALGQAAAMIELAPDLTAMTTALPTLDRQVMRTRQAVEALIPRSFPARSTG